MTTFASYPLLDVVPNFSNTPSMGIIGQIDSFVGGPGAELQAYMQKRPLHSFSFDYELDTLVKVKALRRFFNAAMGSGNPFWMPSWNPELQLARPISNSGYIDIVAVNYQAAFLDASDGFNQESGRNVFLSDYKGELATMRISTVTTPASGIERLTFTTPLPAFVMALPNPGSLMIGLLYFVRFAQDNFDFTYVAEDYVQTTLGYLEVVKSYTEANLIPPGPVACTITASTVVDGMATITWTSSNSIYVFIDAFGAVRPSGSRVVPILTFQTFTITATGISSSASASATAVNNQGPAWKVPCLSPESGSCPVVPEVSSVVFFREDLTPGILYDCTARLRGVMEVKLYDGGTNDGNYLQIGGTPSDIDPPYNVYKMTISDPPQTFYVNRNNTGSELGGVFAVDYNFSLQIRTGAYFIFDAVTVDGFEYPNDSAISAPDDNPTYPIIVTQPYDGQFSQLDLIIQAPH